jgi:hypothetical protein
MLPIRELVSRIHKELKIKQQKSKQSNQQMGKSAEQVVPKRRRANEMASNYVKNCSTSLSIRKCKSK